MALTDEQYAELLTTFERAAWYLKSACEMLERHMPPAPKGPKRAERCQDCKREAKLRGEMYCAKCRAAREPSAGVTEPEARR